MKVGDKVKLLVAEYEPYGFHRNHTYTIYEIEANYVAIYKNRNTEYKDRLTVTSDQLELEPSQSARYNQGKIQTREIDPNFILGIGEVLTKSREKYTEGNWMGETKFSTPYESAQRHLLKFWGGDDIDEETGKSHLLHAATNLMFLYFHLDSGKGIDDRLFKKKKDE